MDIGTGIALSSAIVGTSALLLKVMSKNSYNKALCEKMHAHVEERLNELQHRHDKEMELLTSKVEKALCKIESKIDNLNAKYMEIRELLLKAQSHD